MGQMSVVNMLLLCSVTKNSRSILENVVFLVIFVPRSDITLYWKNCHAVLLAARRQNEFHS